MRCFSTTLANVRDTTEGGARLSRRDSSTCPASRTSVLKCHPGPDAAQMGPRSNHPPVDGPSFKGRLARGHGHGADVPAKGVGLAAGGGRRQALGGSPLPTWCVARLWAGCVAHLSGSPQREAWLPLESDSSPSALAASSACATAISSRMARGVALERLRAAPGQVVSHPRVRWRSPPRGLRVPRLPGSAGRWDPP